MAAKVGSAAIVAARIPTPVVKAYPNSLRALGRRLAPYILGVLALSGVQATAATLSYFYRITPAEVPPGSCTMFHVGAAVAVGNPARLVVTIDAPDGTPTYAGASGTDLAVGSLMATSPAGHYTVTQLEIIDSNGSTVFHRDGTTTFGASGKGTHSINLALADFDVVAPATMTMVGGVLASDTTWTAARSPYVISQKLIIPSGVTLTVSEGVTVIGGVDATANALMRMEVSGHVIFAGTSAHPVMLDDLVVTRGDSSADQPSSVDIAHAVARCTALWPNTGNTGYGSINVRDSYFMPLADLLYVWKPVANCTFERNVFVESWGFSVGIAGGPTPTVTIKNNVFYNPVVTGISDDFSDAAPVAACWANDGGTINVNYNSIYGYNPSSQAWVFKLPSLGAASSAFNGQNNYWDRLSSFDVSFLILDSTKGRDYHNPIPYTPILAAPDPATPPRPAAPVVTAAPSPRLLMPGESTTLTIAATTTPDTIYQWSKNGASIAGATSATLPIANFSPNDAASYTVTLTNYFGTVTTDPVSVSALTSWLTNVSVRAALQPGQPLIVGMSTNNPKSVLLRAAGPALRGFAIADAATDPALSFYLAGANAPSVTNDDWDASLAATMGAVGAFDFAPGSKDAALLTTVDGVSSVVQTGVDHGIVLIEAYDTAPDTFTSRLVNLSARNFVGSGDSALIAGFAIRGTGAKRLLIRGVGPGLAALGIPRTLANPKLLVTTPGGGATLAANDDWDASLAGTFVATGAFALPAGSKDAALIVTLPAGIYSAQVSGADGGSGVGLVEIYEAP